MTLQPLPTYYAPAGRLPPSEVRRQAQELARALPSRELFDAIPDVLMILNQQRQILFANRALLAMARIDDLGAAVGERPGEILNCLHSTEMLDGCGTSLFCQVCGAARAVVSSLDGLEDVQECRISLRGGEALDLRVWSTPLDMGDEGYILLVLKDISNEKRRLMLEHVFFHDILNSAGALQGLADLLARAPIEEKDEIARDVNQVCNRLIEEIKSQKVLVAAESGELNVERDKIQAERILEELVAMYQGQEIAREKTIHLAPDCPGVELISDRALLHRILSNMIKNALEASGPGDQVTVGCKQLGRVVRFWVYNLGVIPPEAQLQIFQRSFSTRGPGRGLGTYSIRLLGEVYLGGEVSFNSSPAKGTTFHIDLPVEP